MLIRRATVRDGSNHRRCPKSRARSCEGLRATLHKREIRWTGISSLGETALRYPSDPHRTRARARFRPRWQRICV